MKCDDKLGPLFESLEEVDDQVSDVFGVGRLECELLAADGGKGEGLSKGFVASEREKKSRLKTASRL